MYISDVLECNICTVTQIQLQLRAPQTNTILVQNEAETFNPATLVFLSDIQL